NRKNEVRDRARGNNGGTRWQRLEVEAHRALRLGHGGGRLMIGRTGDTLVAEEFHVATERDRGQLPARAVLVVKAEELRSEAEREHEHPHAAPARNQEMAELVEEDHHAQPEHERNSVVGHRTTKSDERRKNIQLHHTLIPPQRRPIPPFLPKMPLRQFRARGPAPVIAQHGQRRAPRRYRPALPTTHVRPLPPASPRPAPEYRKNPVFRQ